MAQNLIRLKQLNTTELSGFFASTATNTGAFVSLFSNSNIVFNTGDQIIEGTKIFNGSLGLGANLYPGKLFFNDPIFGNYKTIEYNSDGVTESMYFKFSDQGFSYIVFDINNKLISGNDDSALNFNKININKSFNSNALFKSQGASYFYNNLYLGETGTFNTTNSLYFYDFSNDTYLQNYAYDNTIYSTNSSTYTGFGINILKNNSGEIFYFQNGSPINPLSKISFGKDTISLNSARLIISNNNYISGNYINLQSAKTLTGVNRTGEALLSIRANSTRSILNQTDGFGASFSYQPSLIDKNNISYYFANAGSSSANNINFLTNTKVNANTVNIRKPINIGTASYFDATKRIGFTGNTGLNSPSAYGAASSTSSDLLYFRGTSGYGGFYFKARFGIGEIVSTITGKSRAFIGMSSLTDALVCTSQPSLRATDLLGMGFDSGDNSWYFIHNSGITSPATKIQLGNYTNLIKSGNILELSMYATPNSGVGFHANIINSGTLYETGYFATGNIPNVTTLLGPNFSVYNPDTTNSSTLELAINGIYLESFL